MQHGIVLKSKRCSQIGKRWRCSRPAAAGYKQCENCLDRARRKDPESYRRRGWLTRRLRDLRKQRAAITQKLEALEEMKNAVA